MCSWNQISKMMLKIKLIIIFVSIQQFIYAQQKPALNIQLADDSTGIKAFSIFSQKENAFDANDNSGVLGVIRIKYQAGNSKDDSLITSELKPQVLAKQPGSVALSYNCPKGLKMNEDFRNENNVLLWNITFTNNSASPITIKDLSVLIPYGKMNRKVAVPYNLSTHCAVVGNGSFLYWIPYSGQGNILLMTMLGSTSLEFYTHQSEEVYIHASTAMDTVNDTWRVPATSVTIPVKGHRTYGFKIQSAASLESVRELLYLNGSLDVRVVPGMTVPNDLAVTCALRTSEGINKLTAEFPGQTEISYVGAAPKNYKLYKIRFKKMGENLITVNYGHGKKSYLNFFSTEPVEVLIKKRSDFITHKQQIRDTSKWYDGLYSIWDMEQAKLLSPDDKGPLPAFVVGGSDDPSNCKPLYVSEKNVVYPDSAEIASLEYYEKKFVWGGLQRRDDEYPYPYGIYGSDNWYENRSGKVAGYNSGGWGKERMWRTFDYTTHFAIYFNLYKIARNNKNFVHYLDADGYLERAYRTAKAYFEVPYNIKMGEKWNFHGWSDWAYKQGNFHERYLTEIMDALREHGEFEKAEFLRREWEKKVKYFIYDDPWPFASEMDIDRTAFESTYYVAEYAKEHPMQPQEQLWNDKNTGVWYSHTHITDSATNNFMEKQLRANLALRGVLEPSFNLMGTAWSNHHNLEYMSQMGGVAILDYALKFSDQPAKYVNIGYNSLLSSWALMNSGNEKDGFGYWYTNKKNDGAVGWAFTPWQHSVTYFNNIPTSRWAWKYDGEIDHGLVGAIHGGMSVVIYDSIFGTAAYGCEIEQNSKTGETIIIPKDGTRQRLYVRLPGESLVLKLEQDGFAKDKAIHISGNNKLINFLIENRQGMPHNCLLSFSVKDQGKYEVYGDDKLIASIDINKDILRTMHKVQIPITQTEHKIQIKKVE